MYTRLKCIKCNADARGYECAMCGLIMYAFDAFHECGSGQVLPRCGGCLTNEVECDCI